MSDWKDFLSLENFILAWERLLRSRHYYNKDRIGLRIYAANLEPNLGSLIERLETDVYEPSPSYKVYIPKRSGGLRNFPFLCIEDRLVYQAIANIVAEKSRGTFDAIVRGHVFAHLLDDSDSMFMLRRWDGPRGQYQSFLSRFRELLTRGSQWVIEADIASYYDSIDHALFAECLLEYLDGDKLVKLLKNCLRTWTPHEDGPTFPRGLPQGYEASDYLATLFLFPVDKRLILRSGHYSYIRYVDDFRVLAPNRHTAEEALVDLDIALKKRALVLQGAKTTIREAADVDTELLRLAGKLSLMELLEQRSMHGYDIGTEARTMFFESWRSVRQNSNEDRQAEARLIFAMNRMHPDESTRAIAIEMLREMLWRSTEITNHLSKYR